MDQNDPLNQQAAAPADAPTGAPLTPVPPVWATPAGVPPTAPTGSAPIGGVVPPAPVPPAAGWGPAPVMPGPVTGVAPKATRRRDPLSIVLVIAAFVALGGVGFAFGRVTAPTAIAGAGGPGGFGGGNRTFEFPGGNGAFEFPGGNGGGNFGGGAGRGLGGAVAVRGTVTAITDTQVTVQIAGGGTVNIPISSSTTYHNETAGSASDVKTGSTVLIQLDATTRPQASPGASPGTGAGRGFGSASDITIVAQ